MTGREAQQLRDLHSRSGRLGGWQRATASTACRVLTATLVLAGAMAAGACSPPEPHRHPQRHAATFGENFFIAACQQVAFTSSLRAHERDPALPIDLAGRRYRRACRDGYMPVGATTDAPKVAVLIGERPFYIEAVNLILPEDVLDPLQAYMGRILPLMDDGSLPDLAREVAQAAMEMGADQQFTESLARLERRMGYRPRELAVGALREALGYPRLKILLDNLLAVVGPQGRAHASLLSLADEVSQKLRDTTPAPSTPERTLQLALDLLLTQDPIFGSGKPHWIVRRDSRGLARVLRDPQTQVLQPPFFDSDGDGFPDTDGAGQLETEDGRDPPAPFRLAPGSGDRATRDAFGRAVDEEGNPLYEYLDLDTTLLAGIAREALPLLDPEQNTAFDLLFGLGALLGPRRAPSKPTAAGNQTDHTVDTARSPLLDLAYAGLQLLRAPQIEELVALLREMLADDAHCQGDLHCLPGVAASLTGAALAAKDLALLHPEARLEPRSTLFDDLLLTLRQIADKPGLLEDLLAAFGDPRTRYAPQILANLLTHRDVHGFVGGQLRSQESCLGGGGGKTWCREVDRSRSDIADNRSIQQRVLHLLHNTNRARICNKAGAYITLPAIGIPVAGPFGECELFEIENGAVFFAQAMAKKRDASGRLTATPKAHLRLKTENLPGWIASIVSNVGVDMLLELLSGIDELTSHPTPRAMARLLFAEKLPSTMASVMDPPRDIEGNQISTYHRGTLASWEVSDPTLGCSSETACTFYGAFEPLVQVFADHDAEQLMVDLLSVLHRHWASRANERHQFADPNRPRYSAGSGIVTCEPLLAKVLRATDLLPALREAAAVLAVHRLPSEEGALDMLAGFIRWMLDPAQTPGLTYRDGRAMSFSSDGSYAIKGGVSPAYLLADAWAASSRAIEEAEQQGDGAMVGAWQRATSRLSNLLLGVEGAGPSARFRNRRAIAVVLHLIDFLQERFAIHRARGDLEAWLRSELVGDLERWICGAVLPAAADLGRELSSDRQVISELSGLFHHLIDESQSPQSFAATITAAADLLQLGLDEESLLPLRRQAGKLLSAEQGLVAAALRFFEPALAEDHAGTLIKALRNGSGEQAPGRSPFQTLLDVLAEVHRKQPGVRTPYSGADFAEVLAQVADFLSNQRTGMESFFHLVRNRCIGGCAEKR